MMPGIYLLQCPECGSTREVETGIKTMFCCGQQMVEAEKQEVEEQSEPGTETREDSHVRSGLRLMQCSTCGGTRKIETGIKVTYCCNKEMEEVVDGDDQPDEPQNVPVRLID